MRFIIHYSNYSCVGSKSGVNETQDSNSNEKTADWLGGIQKGKKNPPGMGTVLIESSSDFLFFWVAGPTCFRVLRMSCFDFRDNYYGFEFWPLKKFWTCKTAPRESPQFYDLALIKRQLFDTLTVCRLTGPCFGSWGMLNGLSGLAWPDLHPLGSALGRKCLYRFWLMVGCEAGLVSGCPNP